MMSIEQMEIGDVMRRLRSGERILVICKSRAEAHDRCREAYHRWFANPGCSTMLSLSRIVCEIDSRGTEASIEFGWVETRTGRRLDDVQAACLAVIDPMDARGAP